MSDTTTTPTPGDVAPPAQAPGASEAAPEAAPVETDWKAEARKWEQRAKEYKPAHDRAAELAEQSKTAEQRAAELTAAAEQRAIEAEAKVARRDLALEHSLSAADAALLDDLTDEAAMRRLAERLAAAQSDKRTHVVPTEGKTTPPPAGDDRRAFADFLTGN